MRRYIGTFHKTGTALFGNILRKAASQDLLKVRQMHVDEEPEEWDVAFDRHSKKLMQEFNGNANTHRFVVCIRDPRDVIVSAAYYHAKSDEKWLHNKQDRFGGMTYQEKINSIPDQQDRFLFEMEHSSYWQIQSMLKLPFGSNSFFLTRLETVVTDYKLWEFHKIFDHLEIDPEVMAKLLDISYKNSLFSGKVKSSIHARSGRPAQYLSEFSDATLKRYEEIFSDAASRLGYAEHAWEGAEDEAAAEKEAPAKELAPAS